MTPKEKAMELSWKFSEYSHTDFNYSKGGYQIKTQIENAKKCAIIAVDEILNNTPKYLGSYCNQNEIKFWNEVKTEIEKL